jgi:transcriptional regulator of arginine metabolism
MRAAKSRAADARKSNGATTTRERRTAIRELLASRPIATQEELRELLASRGHDVTQATLSRDLAQLGARRAAHLDGGTSYELPDGVRAPLLLVDLVRTIDDNGMLVVVHTSPGAASVVASALDRARVPEVLGTIAGDDAIFVAPARGVTTARVIRRLRELVATTAR